MLCMLIYPQDVWDELPTEKRPCALLYMAGYDVSQLGDEPLTRRGGGGAVRGRQRLANLEEHTITAIIDNCQLRGAGEQRRPRHVPR